MSMQNSIILGQTVLELQAAHFMMDERQPTKIKPIGRNIMALRLKKSQAYPNIWNTRRSSYNVIDSGTMADGKS